MVSVIVCGTDTWLNSTCPFTLLNPICTSQKHRAVFGKNVIEFEISHYDRWSEEQLGGSYNFVIVVVFVNCTSKCFFFICTLTKRIILTTLSDSLLWINFSLLWWEATGKLQFHFEIGSCLQYTWQHNDI